jgi:hypothetical protein
MTINDIYKRALNHSKFKKVRKEENRIYFEYENEKYSSHKYPDLNFISTFPFPDRSKVWFGMNRDIDKIEGILTSMDVKDAKKATKEIRSKSKKLPRKTMKLENTLNEGMTLEQLKEKIIKRFPEVKDFKKKSNNSIIFEYKEKKFIAAIEFNNVIDIYPLDTYDDVDLATQIEKELNILTKKEAIEKTKEIRSTAKKLPKKKMKLESVLNEMTVDQFKKKLKKGFPQAKITNVKKIEPEIDPIDYEDHEDDMELEQPYYMIQFKYKGISLTADILSDKNIAYIGGFFAHNDKIGKTIYNKVKDYFETFSKDEAIEKTKEIRSNSKKLPKKKMTLESFMNEIL